MRSRLAVLAVVAFVTLVVAADPSAGRDRPFGTSRTVASAFRNGDNAAGNGNGGGSGNADPGGVFSEEQIERFRCSSAAGSEYGTPAGAMDISCNTRTYRQDFNPDNELAVAVNPYFSSNVVAGSNDYFYRFNNSTGARQAIVPTGFFTTYDGGTTWLDGQIPMRTGNGAGDPSPRSPGGTARRRTPGAAGWSWRSSRTSAASAAPTWRRATSPSAGRATAARPGANRSRS